MSFSSVSIPLLSNDELLSDGEEEEDSNNNNNNNNDDNSNDDEERHERRRRDANFRQQVIDWIKELPHFVVMVCIVDVVLFWYSIGVNGGFEPLTVNPFLGPKPSVLREIGAKDVYDILERHQWWRFLSAIFLHVGLFHLLMNLFFQIRTGMQLERSIGFLKTSIAYIVSGIGGNLASAIFLPNLLTVGASGALFGLIVGFQSSSSSLPNNNVLNDCSSSSSSNGGIGVNNFFQL